MIDLKRIEPELSAFLKENNYQMYALYVDKMDDNLVLHVEIDASLDLNTISELSSKISQFMDSKDYIEEAYLLDVATVGLERVLKGHEEIAKAEGKYVYCKLREVVDGLKEVNGYLTKVNDDEIVIDYQDKTRTKQLTVKEANIKLIRFAIKF